MKFRDPRDCWKQQPTYLISEVTYLTIGLLTFIHCKCCLLISTTMINKKMCVYFNLFFVLYFSLKCSKTSGRSFQVFMDGHHFSRSGRGMLVLLATRHWQFLALTDHGGTAGQATTASHHVAMYNPSLHYGFDSRIPTWSFHISMTDPAFIYNASVAVSRLKLPNWAEPFAGRHWNDSSHLFNQLFILSHDDVVGVCVVLIDIPYDITAVKFLHWTWYVFQSFIFF